MKKNRGPRTNLKSKVNAGQAEGTCEYCRFSRPLSGLDEPTLICNHKTEAQGIFCVVHPAGTCDNFDNCGHTPAEIADALAEGAKLIPLSQDKFAIVDAEDYDRLCQYKWCAVQREWTWYAKTFLLDGTPISMHRVITDAPKGLVVHHIDHYGLNNRKKNLLLCTNIQNQRSRGPNRVGSSKYKGVHWCNTCKKFRARITHNGKNIHLGYFESEIDAAKAYDKAAKKFFGEFAYLNFPEGL